MTFLHQLHLQSFSKSKIKIEKLVSIYISFLFLSFYFTFTHSLLDCPSPTMRVINTFFNLFFLAGACLLLIFTVLAGSSKHFPLNKFYWLEADTSNIPNSPANTSAWTFWGVCDKNDYSNCKLGPAYPISPRIISILREMYHWISWIINQRIIT